MISARILIVEDERVVALHLRQQLTRLGYSVIGTATSGSQALKIIMEQRPELVLMDIHIEGDKDGISTAAEIPDDFQVPVVYLTAYSEEATLERARATRPYGYLLKPFSEREMHSMLQMVLERRRADLAVLKSEKRLQQLVQERTVALTTAIKELEEQTAKRLAAEEAFQQAQKMEAIGQLTGGIAHDFNNMLMVVSGSLDIINKNPDVADRVARFARSGLEGVERCRRLIQQLLGFARRQTLQAELVDPNELITGFVPLLRHALGEDVTFVTKLDAAAGHLYIDINQLQAAILNLVVNARESLVGPGLVSIETHPIEVSQSSDGVAPGDYVVVAVSDTGSGILPENLAKVFEPFFTTKDISKGSGLGLSQVYGFMKQSGGQVDISSEVGVGTRVRLILPVATQMQAVAAAPSAMPEPRRVVPTSATVLVVEDDDLVMEMVVENIKILGYSVLTAHNGPAALEVLKGPEPIDLLFSDVMMPGGMSGIQLAVEAKRLRPSIKVLLTSGYPASAVAAQQELPAVGPILAKPYKPEDLADHFQKIIGVQVA